MADDLLEIHCNASIPRPTLNKNVRFQPRSYFPAPVASPVSVTLVSGRPSSLSERWCPTPPHPPHPNPSKCIQSLVCCKTHPRFQLLGTHQRETSIIMMFTIEKIETINRILSNFAGKIVSKDPSGLVIEIAVDDSLKAVSTRQKQLDMTHGCWDCANQLCY